MNSKFRRMKWRGENGKINWMDITREDVIKVIGVFYAENPEYPTPKSTFLIYNGKKLPTKHIRGMAYKVAYGKKISRMISVVVW